MAWIYDRSEVVAQESGTKVLPIPCSAMTRLAGWLLISATIFGVMRQAAKHWFSSLRIVVRFWEKIMGSSFKSAMEILGKLPPHSGVGVPGHGFLDGKNQFLCLEQHAFKRKRRISG